MRDNALLVLYAIGGVFVLLIVYLLRDVIVFGLVSAGTIYLYRLTNGPNDRNR